MSRTSEICGIVLIDKPEGFTSFDVCARLRKTFGTKRIGHGGTLDPMATGLMVVMLGRATLLCDLLPDSDKRYTAGFRLGMTTDTLDVTGETLSEGRYSPIPADEVERALCSFRGEISQLPPMYSAVHKDGRRLYELARQGQTVEREPRQVTVHSLELVSFDRETGEGVLDVKCSKGTYVRSLVDDIGAALGCGGVLTSLRRTEACGFSLENAVTVENAGDAAVIPPDRAVGAFPRADISQAQAVRYANGGFLDAGRVRFSSAAGEGEYVRVYSEGVFLGIGIMRTGELRPHKKIIN